MKKYILLTVALVGYLYLFLQMPQLHGDYIEWISGNSIVKLVVPNNHNHGGTGFGLIGPSGSIYVLTNSHVCNLAIGGELHALVNPEFEDIYNRYESVKVIEISNFSDLCLVEAPLALKGLTLAHSSYIGEEITIAGYPLLQPLTLSQGREIMHGRMTIALRMNIPEAECNGPYDVYDGNPDIIAQIILGARSICYRKVNSVLLSAETYPGNSGSPVFNFWGNVVGIVFAGVPQTNHGIMIPLDDITLFLKGY